MKVRLRRAAQTRHTHGVGLNGRGRGSGRGGRQLGELSLYPNSRGLRIVPVLTAEIKEVRGCWATRRLYRRCLLRHILLLTARPLLTRAPPLGPRSGCGDLSKGLILASDGLALRGRSRGGLYGGLGFVHVGRESAEQSHEFLSFPPARSALLHSGRCFRLRRLLCARHSNSIFAY